MKNDYRELRQLANAFHDRFSELNYDTSLSLGQKFNILLEYFKNITIDWKEILEYLEEFEKNFDEKLYTTVYGILEKWFQDGLFDDILGKIGRDLYVNPEWFGAKADNLTDNTSAFQEAFDFAVTSGIKKVVIPSRNLPYLFRNQIELNKKHSGLEIVGSGVSSKLLLNTRSDQGHLLGIIGDADDEKDWVTDVIIDNICLEVTYEAGTNTSGYLDNPLGLSKCKNIKVTNIIVPHTEWKGITCQHFCRNILIEDCFINGAICDDSNGANCGDNKAREALISIEFDSCEQIRINKCKTVNGKKQGIFVTAAGLGLMNDIKIENCISHCNDLEGIGLSGCGNSVIVSNCITYSYNKSNDSVPQINGTNGIKLFNCDGSIVENCDVRYHKLAGVYLQNSKNCLLFNNTSLLNSTTDTDNRGNFWLGDGSDNCSIIQCDGSKGKRSLTCNGLNLYDFQNSFTGTELYELLGTNEQESRYVSKMTNNNVVNKVFLLGTPPTNTTIQYQRGDRIINKTPSILNNKVITGWLCTTAGVGTNAVWTEISQQIV